MVNHHHIYSLLLKKNSIIFIIILFLSTINYSQQMTEFKPFIPPVNFEKASREADSILKKLSLEEKTELIGGHNYFFIKGNEKYNIPQLVSFRCDPGCSYKNRFT